jgi:hypothetical protein
MIERKGRCQTEAFRLYTWFIRPSWPAGCLYKMAIAVFITVSISACGDSKSASDPAESEKGLVYIPIDDTAFLIPEKTWLKGYSRKKTDGSVGRITLHATVPDVQPWSPERHEEMYWPAGPGKKLLIYIKGDRASQSRAFPEVPKSIRQKSTFIEEISDEADQGLKRYRELKIFNPSAADLVKYRREWGEEQVDRLLAQHGAPYLNLVFYQLVENDRVKYLIYCTDGGKALYQGCHLLFPWAKTLMVDIYFIRTEIGHAVSMADRVSAKLREFETNATARRAARQSQSHE